MTSGVPCNCRAWMQKFREWIVERSDLLTERPAKAPRRGSAAAGPWAALQGPPMSLSGAFGNAPHSCAAYSHASSQRGPIHEMFSSTGSVHIEHSCQK